MDEHALARVRQIAMRLPEVSERLSHGAPCFFVQDRFFRPPTSSSGVFQAWLGVVLGPLGDQTVDWDEVAAIIEEAFRLVAPRHLVVELDERP